MALCHCLHGYSVAKKAISEICFSLSLPTIGNPLCPVVLKFCDAVPQCRYIFTHRAGHFVSIFENYILQFWLLPMKIVSSIISIFISPLFMFCLPTYSLKHPLFRGTCTELFPQYSHFFSLPFFLVFSIFLSCFFIFEIFMHRVSYIIQKNFQDLSVF